MQKILIIIAVMGTIAAGMIYFILIRPVPEKTSTGIVKKKEYKPAGVTWQQHSPTGGRGFNTPTVIPLAEGYRFEITLDDEEKSTIFATLNIVQGNRIQEGQNVKVVYILRSFLWWKKMYVVSIDGSGGNR